MSSELLKAGLPPANDRMLTTCFLAALVHGIVILGVTFSSSGNQAAEGDGPALEVVLVNEQAPAVAKNPNAPYLAQRSQLGSGNTLKRERARIPRSSLMSADRPGIPDGEGMAALEAGKDLGDDEVIATRAASTKILYFAAATADEQPSKLPMLLESRPDIGMASNDDGIELRMRGEPRQQLWISADTRASDVAVYLDSWRRKIERVGTMNFPSAARRGKLSGTPVIEVTIGADGTLLQSIIRRSSGRAELDEAAMRILKLAAPYDPFPGELAAKHDQIRIAYEWQFLDGAAQGSSVFYADPNQPAHEPAAGPAAAAAAGGAHQGGSP
ncbi:MAG TPA: TonB family protein [Steroidobacteraceae bacterium]|nr:TonB family protein [Steroidobacteraceae bacterium]